MHREAASNYIKINKFERVFIIVSSLYPLYSLYSNKVVMQVAKSSPTFGLHTMGFTHHVKWYVRP
jgi:hypothetical protein